MDTHYCNKHIKSMMLYWNFFSSGLSSGTTWVEAETSVGAGVIEEGITTIGEVSPLNTTVMCGSNDCNNERVDSRILDGSPPGVL